MGMSSPNIELHIEELVLSGFPRAQRYEIADAISHELERLFARQVPPSLELGSTVERLDAGVLEIKPLARPEAVGAGIAQQIYGGMVR
jgi:hypothetical protein